MVVFEVPFSKDKVLRSLVIAWACLGLVPLLVPISLMEQTCNCFGHQIPAYCIAPHLVGHAPFLSWFEPQVSLAVFQDSMLGSPGVSQPGSARNRKSMLGCHSGAIAPGLQPDPHPLQDSHGGCCPCLSTHLSTRSSLGTAGDVS